MRVPSGEKATLKTPPAWPLKGSAAGLPSSAHSRTVPSKPPETMRVPSGEKATLKTPPRQAGADSANVKTALLGAP
jgi:hypothetical protein